MVRNLSFNKERFDLVYEAIMVGGQQVDRKNMQQTRVEASILDKLDGISVEGQNGRREVVPDTEISFSEQEYQLIKTYYEITPWKPIISRIAVDVHDWLSGVKQEVGAK